MHTHSQIPKLILTTLALCTLPACKDGSAGKTPLPAPEVLVMEAATRDVPVTREWIGTLDGSENADIRARVTGHLLKRNYQEGSLVKKGDVLFEIDARPFDAALAEAKSQLNQAKAMQLASQAEADRSKQLFDKKVIAENEYTNKAQLNESNLAKVKALEAAVEQAQLNVEFCKVVSPVAGIAGIAKAQVGDLVGGPSASVLTSVSTLNPLKIVFPVSEEEYMEVSERVQENMAGPLDDRPETIELILAGGKTFPHKARLFSVDRQVNQSTGTILVTAMLQNPGSILRPGQFARAKVVAQTLPAAVVVPQRALSEVQGSYQIGVVGPDGKAEIRAVQTGPRSGKDWVITSGLKAGEKVVVEGFQKIKNGIPVAAKPWQPTAAEATPAAEPSK